MVSALFSLELSQINSLFAVIHRLDSQVDSHGYEIPTPELRSPGEWTAAQVAERFGVNHGVVYYWIQRDILPARCVNRDSPSWITLDNTKDSQLQRWARDSSQVATSQNHTMSTFPNQTVTGALWSDRRPQDCSLQSSLAVISGTKYRQRCAGTYAQGARGVRP